MSFTLLICGEGAARVREVAAPLLEELASRGITARAVSDGEAALPIISASPDELVEHARSLRREGAAVVALLSESGQSDCEKLASATTDAVVITWGSGVALAKSHLQLTSATEVADGLAEVFRVLEALGYVPQAGSPMTPAEDAALVERLKELGYV